MSAASSIKLEGCPFCGTSIKGLGEAIAGGGWFIKCECGGEMSADTQIEAIDAWNTRYIPRKRKRTIT